MSPHFQNSVYPPAAHWGLARLDFYPEDGGDIFLRNIGSHTEYTTLYPRRWQHSLLPLLRTWYRTELYYFVHKRYCCVVSWTGKVRSEFSCPKLNSVAWVRERTIPTELPPLVGEVIANFCGSRVPRGQRDGSLRPYSRFLDRSRYFSISSSSVVLTRLSGPRFRPTTFFFLVVPRIEPGPPDL
jgi:hypothetical protein